MEDVLDVYELPYDPLRPVVCMDEKPYQLLGEARDSWAMRPGDDRKVDSEYVRKGCRGIFAFVEPLGGRHHVSVREHRTASDWAEEVRFLVDGMYPDAERIVLVMDNLNTHRVASLYKRYPPGEARRIARRLEIHYTPRPWELARHRGDRAQRDDAAVPVKACGGHRRPPLRAGRVGAGAQRRPGDCELAIQDEGRPYQVGLPIPRAVIRSSFSIIVNVSIH